MCNTLPKTDPFLIDSFLKTKGVYVIYIYSTPPWDYSVILEHNSTEILWRKYLIMYLRLTLNLRFATKTFIYVKWN